MWRYVIFLLALMWVQAAAAAQADAVLTATQLPAQEETATLLTVRSPGRFSLAAHSSTGAALQLVDMLSGPGDIAGDAGVQDGRIDTLLDTGTYKLRVFAAKTAHENISLSVTPFRDAAPAQPVPAPGILFSAELADLQQRSFWITVPKSGSFYIMATGRALADLVLWRNGRDLVPFAAATRLAEPERGHPITSFLLDGKVEPGTYLVTAYGGKKLVWADGATSMPFTLRAGVSGALSSGWVGGTIGASGSEVFALPAGYGAIRLDVPKAADVQLLAKDASASIESTSREPYAVLRVDSKTMPILELRGAAGQAYTLRLIQTEQVLPKDPGDYWVSASTLGVGGDEVPPTIMLLRSDYPAKPHILASTVPHVGPGVAWHTHFNLRGPTQILVQHDAGGELTVHTDGVKIQEKMESNSFYDLPAELFTVSLTPVEGALGSLDATIGPPGIVADAASPFPPDPVIPFGVQSLWPHQGFSIESQQAPGAEVYLSARRIPVALADRPLMVTQQKGQSVTVPIFLGEHEDLSANAIGVAGPLPITVARRRDGGEDVTLPAPDSPRTAVLSVREAPVQAADVEMPAPAAKLPMILAGQQTYFNLAEDETRAFALHVPQGGIFRIETLGRLHSAGEIGTHFIASLTTAEANGDGQNMRLAPWLRAGDFVVRVTARASAGHLGLQAVPAPLTATPILREAGSVRDTLQAGTGRIIPIDIGKAGNFRLTLLGQGEPFSGRVEDADGWPLLAPGPLTELEIKLRAGKYRLIVTPPSTQQRLVAAMARVETPADIKGHGPHPLTPGDEVSATWREPPTENTTRTPDSFTFSLAGPAHAHARLSDGMAGVLIGPQTQIRVADHFDGILAAGDWRFDVSAQGRNDRLDYTLRVDTDEIQPAVPRPIALPTKIPFTLATSRVVTLATTGAAPTKLVLRAADGRVLARADARDNDWNAALSQRLPQGAYTVDVLPGVPPQMSGVTQPHMAAQAESEEGDAPPQDMSPDNGQPDQPNDQPNDQPSEPAASSPTQAMLHLDLPPDLPNIPAPTSLSALAGAGVHVLAIPHAESGNLIVATAHGTGTTMVTLERPDRHGGWRAIAEGSGATALAAAVADSDERPWRATIWSLDASSEPITAAVRVMSAAPADRMVVPDGLDVAVARLALAAPTVLDVAGPPGMLQAGFAGHTAAKPTEGHALPQGKFLWLLGPSAGRIMAKPADDKNFVLDIPVGANAYLPATPAVDGVLHVWRAEGGDGQPALQDGQDLGALAPSSAVLRASTAPVLSNAGRSESLHVVAQRVALTIMPGQVLGTGVSVRIPAGHAVPIRAADESSDLQISLSAGMAGFIGGTGGVWAPVTALTRTVAGARDIMLANFSQTETVARIAPVPHVGATSLQTGTILKRFFGAAESFEIAADVPAGGMISIAGNDASLFMRDAAGHVHEAHHAALPAAGAAHVVITHGPGLVVLWMEAGGHTAWPAASPVDAVLPGNIALSGAAMALRVPGSGRILLHATTTAPVLLGVANTTPELFASGAEFHRVVTAPAALNLFSPVDGPLSGTLSLSAEPLHVLSEGLGDRVSVAPGGTAAFAFSLQRAATIGIGVRAEPDSLASVRIYNAKGNLVGSGVAQLLRDLPAGDYVIEARVPPGASPVVLRPGLFGTIPRASGPPPDIVRGYLEEAGFKP